MNKMIREGTDIWNFSSRVHLAISRLNAANEDLAKPKRGAP